MLEGFTESERRALERLRRRTQELSPIEKERLRQRKEGYSSPVNTRDIDPLRDVIAAYTALNTWMRKEAGDMTTTSEGVLIKKSIQRQTPAGMVEVVQHFNQPYSPIYVTSMTTGRQGISQEDSFTLNSASFFDLRERKSSTGKVTTYSEMYLAVSGDLSAQNMTYGQRKAVFAIHQIIISIVAPHNPSG